MTIGHVDLGETLRRMASRDQPRSEANVQSDLHIFLLSAPLSLQEADLQDRTITLEQQAGSRRRIDVEVGSCVFEVKRDLRPGNVREDAVDQLDHYVLARTESMRRRYVGVLTDGAEWHVYRRSSKGLELTSSLLVDTKSPDVNGLVVWLESVLSTAREVVPTPREIESRLGSNSPGHKLDFEELFDIYTRHQELPTVKLKRELWARLLTTAYGTGFRDDDTLFVEHTLLVAVAEIIAHAVMGLNPTDPAVSARAILSGELFSASQVHGVVESDFFDWPVEVPEGGSFIKSLARRIARFSWRDVEHDVLKVLYESVISAAQRKQLGEYYTPDWLADRVADLVVKDPLGQRVLDPSCGSGTFLFHAVRKYLQAADVGELSNSEALEGVTSRVLGMDLHPVAVTFARVTYLLAIGPDRLRAADRPAISVPVYLGDSIQWGQERTLFTADHLVVPTGGDHLWARDLRFPRHLLDDAGRFDRLVSELSDLASSGESHEGSNKSADALLRRHGIRGDDAGVLAETFRTLRDLHDQGHDHIWGYYVRNLARPVWLTSPDNRVDVLIGNPPWLAFRHMTAAMQTEFKKLSEERGLWAGAAVATNQDLSTLFVLRCIERYLHKDGFFGFVLPRAVLRNRQFAAFRSGQYTVTGDELSYALSFGQAWDLHGVKPAFFPVPAAVVHGQRSARPSPIGAVVVNWSGRLQQSNVSWEVASTSIERGDARVEVAHDAEPEQRSIYHDAFVQGATMVPRVLVVVRELPAGPLGTGVGRITVGSRRTASEKKPWKQVASLEGPIETQFVKPLHLGETLLPYRMLTPVHAVVPWDGKQLMDGTSETLAHYPALRRWWLQAESIWNEHRSSERLSLREQIDYRKKLSDQLPPAPIRVVYNASGMYLAAAVVQDASVIEHSLYWGVCTTLLEARYLIALLNSEVFTARMRPLQARGEHNPRHYDKYVWQVPVPLFDKADQRHLDLAGFAVEAERVASAVELPARVRFESLRRRVRESVVASHAGRSIEALASGLLNG